MKSSEIARKAGNGELPVEEAMELFKKIRQDRDMEIVAYQPKPNRFNAVAVRMAEAGRYIFNHEQSYDHYLDRKDFEEGIKHSIGMVAFGAVGVVDGALEGVVYAASEVAETASYAIARTVNRVIDGWKRGWSDRG